MKRIIVYEKPIITNFPINWSDGFRKKINVK